MYTYMCVYVYIYICKMLLLTDKRKLFSKI